MSDLITMEAPCMFGLESLVADELRMMGAEQVAPQNGRVLFYGDKNLLARANICSRYSERILVLLGSFPADSFETLFEGTKACEWERWIGVLDAFPVKGKAVDSQLYSIPDCQKIIKKAVVERLKTKYRTAWFEERGQVYQIQFLIRKDVASLYLDTSGPSLHKRGYRALSAGAPIKETLAAAMAGLARIRDYSSVVDPFCGSGTILIEAALLAHNIAPGLRRPFAAEQWAIDASVWQQERQRARDQIKQTALFEAQGYDIDAQAVELTRENAKKAGVGTSIKAACGDVTAFSMNAEQVLITNPPYGERLLDLDHARELYRTLGKKFKAGGSKKAFVISPDDTFEVCFGKEADKKRKLYNGMMPCQLYQYFR